MISLSQTRGERNVTGAPWRRELDLAAMPDQRIERLREDSATGDAYRHLFLGGDWVILKQLETSAVKGAPTGRVFAISDAAGAWSHRIDGAALDLNAYARQLMMRANEEWLARQPKTTEGKYAQGVLLAYRRQATWAKRAVGEATLYRAAEATVAADLDARTDLTAVDADLAEQMLADGAVELRLAWESDFDRVRHVIGYANAVVNWHPYGGPLPADEARPLLVTRACDFDWNPSAAIPAGVVATWAAPDEDGQAVNDYLLAVLTRANLGLPGPNLFELTGPTAAGKTTKVNSITAAFPGYTTTLSLTALRGGKRQKAGAHTADMMPLAQKRLVVGKEAQGAIADTGWAKTITGEEGGVSLRPIYGEQIDVPITATVLLVGNERADVDLTDQAIQRRYVPLLVSAVARPDPTVIQGWAMTAPDRRAWQEGMTALCVKVAHSMLEWQYCGPACGECGDCDLRTPGWPAEPAIIAEWRERLIAEARGPLGQWVFTELAERPGGWLASQRLLALVRAEVEAPEGTDKEGRALEWTARALSRAIKGRWPTVKPESRKIDGKVVRGYLGIELVRDAVASAGV